MQYVEVIFYHEPSHKPPSPLCRILEHAQRPAQLGKHLLALALRRAQRRDGAARPDAPHLARPRLAVVRGSRLVVPAEHGADGDAPVAPALDVEVPDDARVDAALGGLHGAQDLAAALLGRARHAARGQRRREHVHAGKGELGLGRLRAGPQLGGGQLAVDDGDHLEDAGVLLDAQQVRDCDASRAAHAVQVVAHEVHDHEVLGLLLGHVQDPLGLGERRHGVRLAHGALHRAHRAEALGVVREEPLRRAAEDGCAAEADEGAEGGGLPGAQGAVYLPGRAATRCVFERRGRLGAWFGCPRRVAVRMWPHVARHVVARRPSHGRLRRQTQLVRLAISYRILAATDIRLVLVRVRDAEAQPTTLVSNMLQQRLVGPLPRGLDARAPAPRVPPRMRALQHVHDVVDPRAVRLARGQRLDMRHTRPVVQHHAPGHPRQADIRPPVAPVPGHQPGAQRAQAHLVGDEAHEAARERGRLPPVVGRPPQPPELGYDVPGRPRVVLPVAERDALAFFVVARRRRLAQRDVVVADVGLVHVERQDRVPRQRVAVDGARRVQDDGVGGAQAQAQDLGHLGRVHAVGQLDLPAGVSRREAPPRQPGLHVPPPATRREVPVRAQPRQGVGGRIEAVRVRDGAVDLAPRRLVPLERLLEPVPDDAVCRGLRAYRLRVVLDAPERPAGVPHRHEDALVALRRVVGVGLLQRPRQGHEVRRSRRRRPPRGVPLLLGDGVLADVGAQAVVQRRAEARHAVEDVRRRPAHGVDVAHHA
ncbi:Uncharacterized protein TPAR_02830, partial [Tolypocladium paradoxum]